MLPARQILTHWTANLRKSPVPLKYSSLTRLLHRNQCTIKNCMSPARLSSTSPRGLKRRRLESPVSTEKRPFSRMPPMLVQEIEDDAQSSSTTLKLTPVESTLTRLLSDVAKYVDETPDVDGHESQIALPSELAEEKVTLRYTGGWVRDKLLGVPSHDIDVAINKMTGYQFGLRMKEYLELPGNLEKYGLESVAANEKQNAKAGTTDKSKTVGGLHKIEANPEKSKHLETTTMRILGLDIDLVNLRKETYTDDSRNPQVEFGTAEEDALRRDATVNAMFYNLNTKETEDFTGRGHEDMAKKIIRTPLEPYQTFKDDPLRVLRLIRFASRLGYIIEPEVLQAMRDAEIKEALRRKISRERVGTELEKSLQGPDPHEALRLIFDLDLYETIFSDPSFGNVEHYKPDTEGWKVIIEAVREIINNEDVLANHLTRDAEERYFAWQLAALVPYRDAPQPQAPPGKKALPSIAVSVAKEGFKATNRVADVIGASVRNQEEIARIVDKLFERKRRPDKKVEEEREDVTRRDILGMAMRRWGASWRSQVIYSLLVEIAENTGEVDALERKYILFLTHLTTLNLLEVYTLKPLLGGTSLAKAIGTPPGPWMKDALDVVMAWQLRHPGVTDPEEAIKEVKNHRQAVGNSGELTFDLIRHFLTLTIRPLFQKTSHPSVTAQGRKVEGKPLPRKLGVQGIETPLWKGGKEASVFDMLRWVVGSLRREKVEEVWPLVIPPLLTLVDDWEVKYKVLGAEFVGRLLMIVEPELLERTGLGEVFEEALMGCLSYLPPTSPEDETLKLMEVVFPTLIVLGRVRYSLERSKKMTVDEARRQRTKFLDKVLRDGIIYGISHCSNHPRIIILLFEELVVFLDEIKIDAVKHIQYVLPLLTETLAHPLAKGSLMMLQRATEAMQALIRNCWPRMDEYRGEVLKGLTFCWLAVEIDHDTAAEKLKVALKDTIEILREAVEEGNDFQTDCEVLIEADGRLKALFLP